jgi:hypothetical protein
VSDSDFVQNEEQVKESTSTKVLILRLNNLKHHDALPTTWIIQHQIRQEDYHAWQVGKNLEGGKCGPLQGTTSASTSTD